MSLIRSSSLVEQQPGSDDGEGDSQTHQRAPTCVLILKYRVPLGSPATGPSAGWGQSLRFKRMRL